MKAKQRLPKGFEVRVNYLGAGRFDVSVNHLGYRVAYFVRSFASPLQARQTGVASAIALADYVKRGVQLLRCRTV